MNAYSEVDGNVTTKETKIDDNKQTSNWDNTSPGSRNQSIFYSSTSNKKHGLMNILLERNLLT